MTLNVPGFLLLHVRLIALYQELETVINLLQQSMRRRRKLTWQSQVRMEQRQTLAKVETLTADVVSKL